MDRTAFGRHRGSAYHWFRQQQAPRVRHSGDLACKCRATPPFSLERPSPPSTRMATISGTRRSTLGRMRTAYRSLINGTITAEMVWPQPSKIRTSEQSNLENLSLLLLIKVSSIMWSSKFLLITLSLTTFIAETPQVLGSETGCPQRHEGRRLVKVSLFDGPPSNHADLVPEIGGYYHLDNPKSRSFSYFALGCSYDGLDKIVSVILPHYIRKCEFTNGPQVLCR